MDVSSVVVLTTAASSLLYLAIDRYQNRTSIDDENASDLGRLAASAVDPSGEPLLQDSIANGHSYGSIKSEKAETPSTLDGTPLKAHLFWRTAQLIKLFVLLLTLCLLAFGIFRLAYDLIRNIGDASSSQAHLLSTGAIQLAFRLYLATLTLRYVRTRNVKRHWDATIHLFVLNTFNALALSIALVPPSVAPLPGQKIPIESLGWVKKVDLSLTLALVIAIGCIQHAPRCHYTPATLAGKQHDSVGDKSRSNVSTYTRASLWSLLFFTWADGIIARGNQKAQLGPGDLPFLPANLRGTSVFQRFADAGHQMSLMLRILYVNQVPFWQQTLLAFITAALYYAPVYFMRALIAYLEKDSDKQEPLAGYLYCLGLFGSLFLDAVLGGQMWFISNAKICSSVRMQLNTMIYAKALRRKDLSINSTGTSASPSETPLLNGGEPEVANEAGSALHVPALPDGSATKTSELTSNTANARVPPHASHKDSEDDDEDESSTNFTSKTQVLNLFSVDVDRIADFSQFSFTVVDAPIELIIGTAFLWTLLGSAGLWGILVNLLFMPLNHYASKRVAKVQDRLMSARDKRTSATNEVLASIRMIKYCAWEAPFAKRLEDARENELRELRRNFIYETLLDGVWHISPVACVVAAFLIYTVIQGNTLTPSIAFASLAVFNELRFALNAIPELLVAGLQAFVSLRRIDTFLNLPEIAPPMSDDKEGRIALRNCTVTWPTQLPLPDSSESRPVSGVNTPHRGRLFSLRNIDHDFELGKLNLITGPLGSGKTLLLLGLLGEADVLAGQIVCPRSKTDGIDPDHASQLLHQDNWVTADQVAYVPQTAWLQNATIEQNILFGLPMHHKRYDAVVYACALTSDFKILEDGDQTEIGANGVTLSGGQKHRVSLARAVYSRAGTLLLDDVLSAVDAHTAAHIFERCLKGDLLEGRTVILVSHHTQLVAPGASKILLLGNGEARFSGSSQDFENSEFAQTYLGGKDEPDSATKPAENKALRRLQSSEKKTEEATQSSDAESESESEESESGSDDSDDDEKKKPRRLIKDEERAVGRVDRSVWMTYFGSNALPYWVIFAVFFIASKLGDVAETGWLSVWSSKGDAAAKNVGFYVAIYAVITFATVVITTAQYLILYWGSIRASRKLHQKMLTAVLRAPLRFFDTTAQGMLANRFAKDLEGADSQLPEHISHVVEYAISILTTIASISVVAPSFLLGFVALSVMYWYYGRQFSHVAREMRRLDSASKSPLFSMYGETVAGASVIRAFGGSSWFFARMIQLVDTNMTYFYHLWTLNRWLSVRFQLISAFAVGLTGYILVQQAGSAAASGFALTFALKVSNDILYLVRRYTALDLAMVSIERIKQMADIEPESTKEVKAKPPASWPHSGKLNIENLCVRYADELPDVLHDVSFDAKPGEKIGVVGQTGSGKSTLAMSFFRFVEAHSGRILLDDIDISQIGLYELRSHLSIIPQDPTILSGTLRSSLDVFGDHSDHEIFDALKRVYLIPSEKEDSSAKEQHMAGRQADDEDANANVFLNLNTEVAEQGSNFSQGQRQLVCLCRAILARSKVVVLDEATSSVDYATDELISATIAKEFLDVTLLVIAHRLRTIITFDKVLVLDAGNVLEFDTPANLLNKPESRFYQLCLASGRREFKILKKMAEGRLERTKAAAAKRPARLRRLSTKVKKASEK